MAGNRTNFSEGLGRRLKASMVLADLSTDDVARKMQLTVLTVRRHMRGDTTPDAEQIVEYGQVLKADPGWLLTGARPKGFEPLTFWAAA